MHRSAVRDARKAMKQFFMFLSSVRALLVKLRRTAVIACRTDPAICRVHREDRLRRLLLAVKDGQFSSAW